MVPFPWVAAMSEVIIVTRGPNTKLSQVEPAEIHGAGRVRFVRGTIADWGQHRGIRERRASAFYSMYRDGDPGDCIS